MRLGNGIDIEISPLSSANADGDGTDDDSVIMPNIPRDSTKVIPISIRQQSVNQGYLQAWIDFDGNGNVKSDIRSIPLVKHGRSQ